MILIRSRGVLAQMSLISCIIRDLLELKPCELTDFKSVIQTCNSTVPHLMCVVIVV